MFRRLLPLSFCLFVVPFVVAADAKPVVVKFGKLTSAAPAEWINEKPANRLRSYQFKIKSDDPSLADAELYLMPDGNPDPEKSFPRWKTSFAVPQGMTADDLAKVSKFDVKGATVHVLDMTGTWKYKERPFDPKSKEELRPDYRVVWVIVAETDEATHLRLSGPAEVVGKQMKGFENWLKAMK